MRDVAVFVMVSVELFRFKPPSTVETLSDEAEPDLFSLEARIFALLLPLIELAALTGVMWPLLFGGRGGFLLGTVVRTATLFDELADAADVVERIDVVEDDLLVMAGLNFDGSTGVTVGLLAFVLEDDDEIKEVVEGSRDLAIFGVEGPVVLMLMVETVDVPDVLREGDAESARSSEFAVLNVVEASLVLDIVESGRDGLDDGRSVVGPAGVVTVRIVDACDLTDEIEDANDFGLL